MRRISGFAVLFMLLFVLCGKDREAATLFPDGRDAVEGVLTYESSFSEEDLPSDYLISNTWEIEVSPGGDFLVPDRENVKVFDSDGNPKQTFGRAGGGPGEFEQYYSMTCSPTGYVALVNDLSSPVTMYNLFAPDYTFIEKKDKQYSAVYKEIVQKYRWRQFSIRELHCYAPGEWLMVVSGVPEKELNDPNHYWTMFHETDENYAEIAVFPITPEPASEYRYGEFVWTVPDEQRVVYYHPLENRLNENGSCYYVLTVYNRTTGGKSAIRLDYTPAAIPESVIENERAIRDNMDKRMKEWAKKHNDEYRPILREIGVYPPVLELMSDGRYVFVFTHVVDEGEGRRVEVIDIDSGERVSTVSFPDIPEIIDNGYAYFLKFRTDTEFAELRKYRIEPAVFGK